MRAKQTILGLLFMGACIADASATAQNNLEYRSYTAYAERGKSLYQVLAAASPFHENGRSFLGHTSRDVHWQLRWRDDGSGMCRITEVRVTLHTTITLPQLDGIDPERQSEYTRFYTALRIHENGHYRIEQQMAEELDLALNAFPATACSGIESAVNARGNDIMHSYDRKEVQYDAETDHGRTQGAYLRN